MRQGSWAGLLGLCAALAACPAPDGADAARGEAGGRDRARDDGGRPDAAVADASGSDRPALDAAGRDTGAVDATALDRSDAAAPDGPLLDGSAGDRPSADATPSDRVAADQRSGDAAAADRPPGDGPPADAVTFDAGQDPWPLAPDVAPLVVGPWYRPALGSTWQWQLTGALNSSYDVAIYDVDLFETSSATITALHGQGRKVLCYFSAGSSENWRPDFAEFDAADLGNPLDGWAGERWLDIRSRNVWEIMLARLDLAASKGCDGVEPDNVDGFDGNDTGFALTATDQLAYNRNLANAAHRRGLAVALKNDVGQVAALVAYYDLTVNEECHDYDECDALQPFVTAGKPVLNAEYADSLSQAQSRASTLCPVALGENVRTLILPLDLDDSFRVACD